jgi:hypothetical protein
MRINTNKAVENKILVYIHVTSLKIIPVCDASNRGYGISNKPFGTKRYPLYT